MNENYRSNDHYWMERAAAAEKQLAELTKPTPRSWPRIVACFVVGGLAYGIAANVSREMGGGFNAATETDGNMDASDAYYVADNGIVTLPATEPTHIGYFGVCVTADASTTVCGGWLTNCFWK